MAVRTYLEKFEPLVGTTYTFPRAAYQYEPSMGGRSPVLTAIGADYGLRLRGTKNALKDVGQEQVNAAFVGTATQQDAHYDAARLLTGKYGKLWTLRDDGTRRWAWSECIGMPNLTFDYRPNMLLNLGFSFNRFTDWFMETVGTGSATITSNGQTFSVTNNGNLPATQMTIRLRANTSGGFTNPIITNTTASPDVIFQSVRDSVSTSSELRLDTRRPAVEWSDNDGASYTDDLLNYVLPPVTQKVLTFMLLPGSNTIQVNSGGTPNVNVEFSFDQPFA